MKKTVLLSALAAWAMCSAIDSTFLPETGCWSDPANWSDGVPNGRGDTARFAVGVRAVTNDVEGLVVYRLALQSEGGTHVWFEGNPMTVVYGNNGLGSRHVHLNVPATFEQEVQVMDGWLYLHRPATFPAGASVGSDRRLVFPAPADQGAVRNFSTGGTPLTTLGGKKGRFMLTAEAGTDYLQEVGLLRLPGEWAEVEPAAHTTLSIRNAAVNGILRHMGSGTVEFPNMVVEGAVDALFQNADGEFVFRSEDVSGERPALNPLVHLDASDAASFVYKDGDPAQGVVRWNGVDGAGYAYHDLCVAEDGTQVLPVRRENVLNGRAVVDFGEFYNKGYGAAANRAKGGYLILDCGPNRDHDVYTAFVVECSQNFIFTSQDGGQGAILHGLDAWNQILVNTRGESHVDFRNPSDGANPGTGLGYTRLNGVTVDAWSARLSGKDVYDAIGLRAETRPIHIGRLAWDRTWRSGAAKIAEVILYSRRLTDREFAATETYLRNKWQNAGVTPVLLEDRNAVETLVNQAATPFRVVSNATLRVTAFDTGLSSARRVFTGGGTLELARVTEPRAYGAEQPVMVRDGTLAPMTATDALVAPETCPIADAFFHLDASDAASFTLEDGDRVAEWRDVTGNGRAAKYAGAESGNVMPRLVPCLLNGLPGVDFGEDNSHMCLLWNHTNTTMRTVFVVYGNPGRGDNFLLGDTYRNNVADFHRGGNGTMFYSDGYVAAAIKTADLRVNGRKVVWNGHYLPAEPCVLMVAATNGTMSASAFAVDRWGHPSNGMNFRTGGQQICEAVVYDRVLDLAEREAVQNWLIAKWMPRTPAAFALKADEEQFDDVRSAATDGEMAAVRVAEGTARVGALSGADFAKTGAGTLAVASTVDLTGALTLAEGAVEVSARDLPADWTPPPGYVSDGSAVDDVRAVFAVCDRDDGTLPDLVNATDANNDVLRIDGVRQTRATSAAWPGGVHVVSLRTCSRRRSVACNLEAGPFRELLCYRRTVTDRERRDIEAHLARKWRLGGLPGYGNGTNRLARVVAAGGAVRAAGGALVVDSVAGDGALSLGGAVTVKDAGDLSGTVRVAADASVTLAGAVRATEDSVPQEGLVARFDMSHREALETYEENGTNFVTRWNDMTGRHYAEADPTNRPWIIEGDCNGHDVLCTGPYSSISLFKERIAQAGWLHWDNRSVKVRTVVEVIGAQEGGLFLVTGQPGSPCIHRGGAYSGGMFSDALLASGRTEPTDALYGAGAYFAINGVQVNPLTTGFPSADYHSVAVRVDPDFMNGDELGYFYIGHFGQDRVYRWGGQRVCEVLAYDRRLTDDEMAALEAYLPKKWFNRAYRDFVAPGVSALELAGGTVDLGGDARVFASVAGTGTVRGGQLNVAETFAPDGLTVEGVLNFAAPNGVIRLPGDRAPARGAVVTLGSVGGLAGNWSSWTIEPMPEDATAQLVVSGGRLQVRVGRPGTVLIFR